jgi:hypothetical protein
MFSRVRFAKEAGRIRLPLLPSPVSTLWYPRQLQPEIVKNHRDAVFVFCGMMSVAMHTYALHIRMLERMQE